MRRSNIACACVLSLLLNYPLKAQFSLFTTFEAGTISIKDNNEDYQPDYLLRFEGDLKYKTSDQNKNLFVQAKGRQELLGFVNPLQSLKLKGVVDYVQSEEDYSWAVNFLAQKNDYYSERIDLTSDVFMASGVYTAFLQDGAPVDLMAGYAYQKITEKYDRTTDMLFASAIRSFSVFNNSNFGSGFYAEHFTNTSPYQYSKSTINRNNGWRYGPQLSFNHLSGFVLKLDYRLFIHNSDLTLNTSIEQSYRFVAGKNLSEAWSIFLLVDYYLRSLRLKPEISDEELSLLYVPVNNENRVFLKLAYNPDEVHEFFFKVGYFKENITRNKYSFVGYHFTAGIQFKVINTE